MYLLSKDQPIGWEQQERIKFTKRRTQVTEGDNLSIDSPRPLPVKFHPESSQPMFTILADGVYHIEIQIGVNNHEYPAFSLYLQLSTNDERSGILARIKKTTYDMHMSRQRTFKCKYIGYFERGDYLSLSVHNKAPGGICIVSGDTHLIISKV